MKDRELSVNKTNLRAITRRWAKLVKTCASESRLVLALFQI